MKNRVMTLVMVLGAVLTSAVAAGDPQKDGIDAEGYLCKWIVMAPIPIKAGEGGSESLGQAQVKDEAALKAKVGDKIEVGGKTLEWKECQAKEQALDFNELLGKETENSIGYGIAYLVADADFDDVTLKIGSDDQAKVYLNGKLIYTNDEARPFEKDEDSVPGLSLKKGLNVLVVKVVNEEDDWLLSARFLDAQGKPVTRLKATTKPD